MPDWKRANARYLRSQTGGGHWEKKALPESWQVHYKDLTFQVKPMNFKHTGLFPEQAVNWDFAMDKIRKAGRPIRVLNLFAYTGGATVACAKAGASRLPCGCGQGHGGLGQGQRPALRSRRRAHPLDRGRLRQVRGAGDSPWQDL